MNLLILIRKIREDYLADSTVTIFLIGNRSSEAYGWNEQKYIKRELQASLYNSSNNPRNGILGIVLPSMYDRIYQGSHICSRCNNTHNWVSIGDATTVKEFSYNYYLPLSPNKCAWSDEDRYCILVKWDDFKVNPEYYIQQAYDKRFSDIASKIKVRP